MGFGVKVTRHLIAGKLHFSYSTLVSEANKLAIKIISADHIDALRTSEPNEFYYQISQWPSLRNDERPCELDAVGAHADSAMPLFEARKPGLLWHPEDKEGETLVGKDGFTHVTRGEV